MNMHVCVHVFLHSLELSARLLDLWGTSCRYEKNKAAGVSF